MDFLNKAFAQLSDLFRSMTPGARITAGLLLVVVVLSLGYLVTHQLSGPAVYLFNGAAILPNDRPAMLAAFARKNLNSYVLVGNRIRVPRNELDAYMGALDEAKALPRNFGQDFEESLQQASVFDDRWKQEKRDLYAKQKELARILRSWDHIADAAVIIDMQTQPGLKKEKVITASVSITPYGSGQLDPVQVPGVRQFMLGAIAGLKPENLKISDSSGQTFSDHDPENGGPVGENVYVALKRFHEQEWKRKILKVLTYVPGVEVTANVVLDTERVNRSKIVKYDAKPTTVQEKEKTRSSTSEGSTPGGRPGYPANAANTPAALAARRSEGTRNEEEESNREVVSLPNAEQTEKEKVGLTPTRVSVSIVVPVSYFTKVWQERNQPQEGEEPRTAEQNELDTIREEVTRNIQTCVANLLPEAEGVTDRSELVKVTTFQDIKPEELPAPGLGENALVWFGRHWSMLGMIGLALFSLVMLRSMIRAGPAEPPTGAVPGPSPAETEEDEQDTRQSQATARLRRFTGSGPSLRDELSQLVQDDPDTASGILKTWIGKAS